MSDIAPDDPRDPDATRDDRPAAEPADTTRVDRPTGQPVDETRLDRPAGPRQRVNGNGAEHASRPDRADRADRAEVLPEPGAVRDGALPPRPRTSVQLPLGLEERFTVVEELPTQGAQATVLLADEVATGERRVLKVYRRGFVPDSDLVRKLLAIGRDSTGARHVVVVHELDVDEGTWYEVQEYCSRGSLRELCGGGSAVDPRHLAAQVGAALTYLQDQEIVHRDVKPANVMVRSDAGPDLVLGDFGVARSIAGGLEQFTENKATPAYQPPEATENRLNPAWDWWSLGMMVAEAALGHHPLAFDDGTMPNAAQIPALIRDHAVDVSAIDDPRLRDLCRGLLVRDYRRRWRGEQVEAWLQGADPDVPSDPGVAVSGAATPRYRRGATVRFAGVVYDDPDALAQALQERWDHAIERLFREHDPAWIGEIEAFLRDRDLLGAAQSVVRGGVVANPHAALASLLLDLSVDIQPVFDGLRLTPAGLEQAAQDVLAGRSNGARLDLVRQSGVLRLWRSLPGIVDVDRIDGPWRDGWERIDELIGAMTRRGARLDREASDRAKAWLLLCLLDRRYESELQEQLATARRSPAATASWWYPVADEGRRNALPAAALAVVTAQQASLLEEERRTREQLAEEERRAQSREEREADRLRRREERAALPAAGFVARGFGRAPRWAGWDPWAGTGEAPASWTVVTLLGAGLLTWHLWLFLEFEAEAREVFAGLGRSGGDIAILDNLASNAGVVVVVAVVFVATQLLGRRLGERLERPGPRRVCTIAAAVVQVLTILTVAYTGLVSLPLSRAAGSDGDAGPPDGHLPGWLEALDVVYGTVLIASLGALMWLGARFWRITFGHGLGGINGL